MLYSEEFQLSTQKTLATIAVVCVPIMLFGKPLIKAIIYKSSGKSKKNYVSLGSGKKSLIKDQERRELFDEENIKSDSLNIHVKDFSTFKHPST